MATHALRRSSGDLRGTAVGHFVIVLLLVSIALWLSLLVPVGFQGRDDLHYLVAAKQWLTGPTVGVDHWANRLPYVLAISASRLITGSWETGLYLLHSLCFVAAALSVWLIGRSSLGHTQSPLFGVGVFVATPLLFRLPSTFYPEALQIALGLVTTAMVFWRSRVSGPRSAVWMFAAGVVGGCMVSTRETAIVLPAALAAVILLDTHEPLASRLRDVAFLAIGYALPLLVEILYYWAATGNPLYRYSVDARHIQLVSPDRIAGGVPPHSTRVLFNWDLESRWRIPSVVHSHWTIAPIVRLFTSPGMLLTPWFAIAGGILAWRMGPRSRELVILVIFTSVAQYFLDTFVLSLPPDTRYFSFSLALMCLLAGVALVRIRPRALAWATYLFAFVLPCAVVAEAQPRPSVTSNLVERTAGREGRRLHVIGQLANTETLRLTDHPGLASLVSPEPPPVAGLVAGFPYDRPADWDRRCPDGSVSYVQMERMFPDSAAWRVAQGTGFANKLPRRLVYTLRRGNDAIDLFRRNC